MPEPSEKEKKSNNKSGFMRRCIPMVIEEGTAKDTNQAIAICYSIWERAKKPKK